MSRLSVARKIRENHQNNNNSKELENEPQIKQKKNGKQFIYARMVDTYGKKDNYHLNEINIKYQPEGLILEKDNKNNLFRIRNVKHSKNRKENDFLNINPLKEQNNDITSDKRKMKLNYRQNNNNCNNNNNFNGEITKYTKNNINNSNKKADNIIDVSNKTDNLYYTNSNPNNITNTFQTNINNYFSYCNFLLTMKNNEMEDYLENLWKKLGIKDNYINIFKTQKNNITNPDEKLDFMISEIENLKRFEEILIALSTEIEGREKNINMIKNFFDTLNIKEKEEITENKVIMNDFTNLLISYRESSIKVIEYYLLFNEKIIRGNIKGKFDEDYLMKKYGIIKNDLHYLIKMKNDMSFLCNTKISNSISNKEIFNSYRGDPFLTCLYNLIPVSKDYKQKIKYCQYFIIQETLNEKLNIKNANNPSEMITIKENKTKIKTTHINIDTSSNQSTVNNINNKMIKNDSDLNKKYNKNIINKKHTNSNYEENKNDMESIQNTNSHNKNNNTNNNFTFHNKEENIAIVNNNEDNYSISYYTGAISKFITLYDEYYKNIPEEQKKIFHIQENPMIYLKHNYYPKIIMYQEKNGDNAINKDNNSDNYNENDNNSIKGLCIYSVILSYSPYKPNQIIIEHLSSCSKEEMENIFRKMFEFLKNNSILNSTNTNNNSTVEIFIDLYFYLENEKFLIDAYIRDFIKNEFKFRWVKLENISKGIRFQKMKHSFNVNTAATINEYENEIDVEEKETISTDNNNFGLNFYIKNKSIMQFMKKKEALKLMSENSINSNNENDNDFNPFNVIYIMKKLLTMDDEKYSNYIFNNIDNFLIESDKAEIQEIMNKTYEKNNSAIKEIFGNNNSFIASDFKELVNLDLEGNKNADIYNKFDIITKMNILPLFDNCISVKYKNIYYNRIENNNIKIFIDKTTNQKFYYLTPVNNENINLLISTSLNQEFIDKYIMTRDKINFSLKFKDIYNNFEITENNNEGSGENKNGQNETTSIYVPSFKIYSKINKNYKNKENKEQDNENLDKFIINNYNEYCKIQFISEDLVEKYNRNNIGVNFYYDKIEEEYTNNKETFIDNDFIIFIINFDVIDNIAAIPLISLYVSKNNFISDN